jgi:hypothetical protein
VSFAAITLCIASQLVVIVSVVYFVIDSVRKLLYTPSYTHTHTHTHTCINIYNSYQVRLSNIKTIDLK